MNKKFDIIVVGTPVVDISVRPCSPAIFATNSFPAEQIKMGIGGDSLNEAVTLTRLGNKVKYISKTGNDHAGNFISSVCLDEGIDTTYIKQDDSIDTGINVVMVDSDGERRFLTNPKSSLRRFYLEDIPLHELNGASILSFASIFVYPCLNEKELLVIFQKAKENGLLLCADMTRAKNGEHVKDIASALSYVDFLFPNYEEAKLLTNETSLDKIADTFLNCGLKNIIIKTGKEGCFIKNSSTRIEIPAYPDAECIDTTGAGDTFAAAFLHGLTQNYSLEECGRFANAAASICVEHIGSTAGLYSKQQVEKRFSVK